MTNPLAGSAGPATSGIWRMPLDAALSTRALLPTHGRDISDLARWEQVRNQADQAALSLEAVSSTAPDAASAAAAHDAADAFRSSVFALESARLTQTATPAPTAEQLAAVDAETQQRQADLDAALNRLDVMVRPPGSSAPPAT